MSKLLGIVFANVRNIRKQNCKCRFYQQQTSSQTVVLNIVETLCIQGINMIQLDNTKH